MNTKEILTKARKLIINPNHWTKWVCARNSEGIEVRVGSPEVCSFCSIGAIWRTELDLGIRNSTKASSAEIFLEKIINSNSCSATVSGFNDTRSHEEVIAMFDKAIKECNE